MLRFLQQLNKEGSTVILITHDNGIAATARRCVRLQDGKIVEDRQQEVDWLEYPTGNENGPAVYSGQQGPVHPHHAGHHHRYRLRDDHRVGGQRTNQQSLKQFEAMGTNRISVSLYLYSGQDSFEDLYNFCNSLGKDLVVGVTPSGMASTTVSYGTKNSNTMQKNQE